MIDVKLVLLSVIIGIVLYADIKDGFPEVVSLWIKRFAFLTGLLWLMEIVGYIWDCLIQ